jgi:hypothetical protein
VLGKDWHFEKRSKGTCQGFKRLPFGVARRARSEQAEISRLQAPWLHVQDHPFPYLLGH